MVTEYSVVAPNCQNMAVIFTAVLLSVVEDWMTPFSRTSQVYDVFLASCC